MTSRRSTSRAEMADRARWTPTVNTGTVTCARCHEPIHPDPSQPHDGWEMGHPIGASYADGNRDPSTRRPEHTDCNRRDRYVTEEPAFTGWPA